MMPHTYAQDALAGVHADNTATSSFPPRAGSADSSDTTPSGSTNGSTNGSTPINSLNSVNSSNLSATTNSSSTFLTRKPSTSSNSSATTNSPPHVPESQRPHLRVRTSLDPTETCSEEFSQTDSGDESLTSTKRLWVRKKSGGACTSLIVHGNELVDDVKTRILERYPTSLLLKCDPADLVLTVQTHSGIRLELQPDERIAKIIDKYFPKGMKMNDALEVGPPVANWGVYDKGSSQSRSTSRSSIRSSRGQIAQQPTPLATSGTPMFTQTPSSQPNSAQQSQQMPQQNSQSQQTLQSVQSAQSVASVQSMQSIPSAASISSLQSLQGMPGMQSQPQLQLTPSQLQLVQSTTQLNQLNQPNSASQTPNSNQGYSNHGQSSTGHPTGHPTASQVNAQLHSQLHSQSLPLLHSQGPNIVNSQTQQPHLNSASSVNNSTSSVSSTMPFPPVNESHQSHHISPTDPVEGRKVSPQSLRQNLSRRDSTASNHSHPHSHQTSQSQQNQSQPSRRRKQSNTSVLLLPRQLATGSHSGSLDSIASGSAMPTTLSKHSSSSSALTPVSASSKSYSFNTDMIGDANTARLNKGSAFPSTETLRSPLPLNEGGYETQETWINKLNETKKQGFDEKKRDITSNSLFELQQRVSPSIQISQEGRAIIVPQIKVLIVEDNPINQRLLEAFMKRKKVRYGVAKNGREALDMWRAGGYHLIFMDIQLPVMTGLEATKEIRRLEVVNGIGVPQTHKHIGHIPEEDVIVKSAGGFRSPVIIVALTASNDQDDKSDALAAGCNDFLTKPVSFSWLEKKIIEWGCMQALIDYDGWKTWNDVKTEDKQDGVLKSLPTVQVGQTT